MLHSIILKKRPQSMFVHQHHTPRRRNGRAAIAHAHTARQCSSRFFFIHFFIKIFTKIIFLFQKFTNLIACRPLGGRFLKIALPVGGKGPKCKFSSTTC
ncbi:Os12g0480300 [Oryza sativa Japonica Group]|uniref:Os12g0480300 protein n=1 Tax=Oryza sativa subsp. japonica TaxID=39947 RepID=A0A0P0YA89_ORYSJ|nr:Os12g0480300 [Oryza sativa Japonica Group]